MSLNANARLLDSDYFVDMELMMSIGSVLFERWMKQVDERLDFLTERSNKMAGEYEDLMQTVADERAQFLALKQSNDALVAALNAHIAELQAAGTNPTVGGIVISPEKFEALKAAVKGIVPDETVAPVTPVMDPVPAVDPAPAVEPAPVDPAPVNPVVEPVPADPAPEAPVADPVVDQLAPVAPSADTPAAA